MKNAAKSALLIGPLLLAPLAVAHGHGHGIIQAVHPHSPAAVAGLREGDQLLRLDGRGIATANDLREILADHQPGDTVPVTVERNGEAVDLELTLGEGPGGGVSMGISVALSGSAPAPTSESRAPEEPTMKGEDCLGWVDATYELDATSQQFGFDMTERLRGLRSCIAGDIARMPATMPVGWCDNVFKVHCSGMVLLTELGEAMIEGCEEELGSSLGLTPRKYEAWRRCASDRIFDGYSRGGFSGREKSCQATFLEDCAVSLDAIPAADLSEDQKSFVACCSADSLDACPMIEESFTRGPCLDHPVCVNARTSEWTSCSSPDRSRDLPDGRARSRSGR